MPLTIVSWNVHGSGGLDTSAVARHLTTENADVVVLQEIRRGQAADVADAIGATTRSWCFKHRGHPLRPAEGMAVLAVGVEPRVSCTAVTARWRWWSWRRRLLQVGTIEVDGLDVTLLHTHLTPHADGAPLRLREVDRLIGRLAPSGASLVAGDLNEGPEAPALTRLRANGLRDAWEAAAERSGPGATNWSTGQAGAPDQRLDYVLCGAALQVHRAAVPDAGTPGSTWRDLSDHLPVTATVGRGGPLPVEPAPPPSGA